MSLLCEARRFSNHYGIVNNIIIIFVAACSCDIYDFSLLDTSFNTFTTSVIMHAGCGPSVWRKVSSLILWFLKVASCRYSVCFRVKEKAA